ncbi:ROK family protein [Micromonospora sp. LOL_015]|uniref:ROK family protein n=1 Tax=Micromonospora sp. LOL_015 TaxID=3345416 RepID=UPI003A8BE8CC
MTGGPTGRAFVVVDVGGTTLRVGRYEEDGQRLIQVIRTPLDGLGRYPDAPAAVLQRRVLMQVAQTVESYLGSPAGEGVSAVGIAFAGPVTADGVVTAAPTVWGGGGSAVEVGAWLRRRLAMQTHVVNDMTASVWRYARPGAADADFCLITVSSGIGNKVYRDGVVLVDRSGAGGEMGHWPADPTAEDVVCDCGGRGHLGAIASGRGILKSARLAGGRDLRAFRDSMLGASCAADPAMLTNEDLVRAIRFGDNFALSVLRAALRPLAQAIAAVHSAIGIGRYVIIGGFATAVGDQFAHHLGDQLAGFGCFGLSDDQARSMIEMGAPDDDHALIGMGRMLSQVSPAVDRQGVRHACPGRG